MLKILSYHTRTHQLLFDKFFKPSIKDTHTLISKIGNQVSHNGEYFSNGFNQTMKDKIMCVRESLVNISENDFLLYSDVDVIFIEKIEDYIKNYYHFDLVFQKGYSGFNAGFFIVKNNKNVIEFLDEVISECHNHFDDQHAINYLITKYYDKLNYAAFDDQIFSIAATNGGHIWQGGDIQFISNILVFHACWCVGIDNKIKLLNIANKHFQLKI